MSIPPTVVRLLRFPKSLTLTRKGREFRGPAKRSGALVLSERHDPVDVTLRSTVPGVTFATGGTSITRMEPFAEGEQRDLLVPWSLVVDATMRTPQILLELEVGYADTPDRHVVTVPIKLSYGRVRTTVAVGAAVAAAAAVATAVVVKTRKASANARPAKKK